MVGVTGEFKWGLGQREPSTLRRGAHCPLGRVGETWASSEELREMLYDFLSGQSADSLTVSSSQPWASYLRAADSEGAAQEPSPHHPILGPLALGPGSHKNDLASLPLPQMVLGVWGRGGEWRLGAGKVWGLVQSLHKQILMKREGWPLSLLTPHSPGSCSSCASPGFPSLCC